MARAQSQYLRIYDTVGTTYHRWQSYYTDTIVSWESTQWTYVPFIADGYTAGISGDENNVSVKCPAIPIVVSAFESAIKNGHLVELRIYQFDVIMGNTLPLSTQTLIGQYTGQASGGSATLTAMVLSLGSALSPVGAQIPPRKFTNAIMGMGCVL